MGASNTFPTVPPVSPRTPEGRAINLLLAGRTATTVTLAAGATSTTLTDSRIGMFSHLSLTPTTATAAAAIGVYVETGAGSAVINHDNTADTDRTFSVAILG